MKLLKPWSKSISKVIDDYYGGRHLEIPKKQISQNPHEWDPNRDFKNIFIRHTKFEKEKKKHFRRTFEN